MKTKLCRTTTVICALLLLTATLFSLGGCKDYRKDSNSKDPNFVYDKYGNTYPAPTDNDEEGWFSVETLAKYGVIGLAQPKGSEVTNKPQPDALYLTGDDNLLKNTAIYAYTTISGSGATVYVPETELDENQMPAVTKLTPIDALDTSKLAPDGTETSVSLVYTCAKKLFRCDITLETNANNIEQVYIAFSDKTEDYKNLL
ncbi:MAG: hypothetical protein Q4D44_07320 [Eubacteriales bacterium]|nr:hypothetical protein [Eubacteriales bacterium]